VIKLPKKKYTPKQDVQLGKEAASEVRKQYPSSRTSTSRSTSRRLATASSPRRRRNWSNRSTSTRHAGEPERRQRVRAAGRTDVRATGHVRRGGL